MQNLKKIIVQHQLDTSAVNRFRYLINFINTHPLKPLDLHFEIDNNTKHSDIHYGNMKGDFHTIPLDACFFDEHKIVDAFFPTSYLDQRKTSFVAVSDKAINPTLFYHNNVFGFDLFNTIFFHISRYEEYYASLEKNGMAGWLKEEHHFLIENNLYENPVVDEILSAFFEIIIKKRIDKKSTYSLSHDVDIIQRFTPINKFVQSLGATIVHRRDLQQLRESIQHYYKMSRGKAADPYDYFSILLREENQWIDKRIFMMAGGNTKYDNYYSIDDPTALSIIQLAENREYTIGLHPSYNAGFELIQFKEEKEKLEMVSGHQIHHSRQHWLRWSWDITPHLLTAQRIQTDSSMGYARYVGFRCATGFPYRLYDFKNEKVFSWVEHPMTFMESSAIHRANKTGIDLTKLITDFLLLNKKNTHLILNFHNSNFDPLLASGRALRHFYEKELLDICFSQI